MKKKVLFSGDSNAIHVSNIKTNAHVGFIEGEGGNKGMTVFTGRSDKPLSAIYFEDGRSTSVPNISSGNSDINAHDTVESVLKLYNNKISKAYVFDTSKELFKWLSE